MRRLFLLASVLSGCGSDAPPTLRDFSHELWSFECRVRFQCCAQAAQAKWTDEATCEAMENAQNDPHVALVEGDIASGAARYDQQAAAKLLDLSRTLMRDCATPVDAQSYLDQLNAVVVGLRDTGASCMELPHVECAPGAGCQNSICTVTPPKPTPLAAGASCQDGADCQSSRCTSHVCVTATVADLMCSF